MKTSRWIVSVAVLMFAGDLVAQGQQEVGEQAKPMRLKLSGPRVGFTLMTGNDADELRNKYQAGPVVSQFGWQYETQLFDSKEGISGLSEWVGLVGGVEQGVFLPSVSWLVGLRFLSGTEFGVGPTVNLAGAGLVLAGGSAIQTASFNFPINVALVLAKGGTTVSLLVGFTSRE